MLTCHNLSAKRNGKLIFENIGFTLFSGSCLFIKGRNGIGKTTLLRIIANLSQKEKGDIFFNGINIKLSIQEYYNLLFYVGKREVLDQQESVLKNLEFIASMYKQTINIAAAIRTFSLEPFIHTEIFKLSEGFKQRVLLSRLLLTNAKIWILDEPFNSLDREGLIIVNNLIKARCGQQGIVIIANHISDKSIDEKNVISMEDFSCD
ncbi:MAG: heme exporter protein A [Candidatus Midichloriaceae bacterium]|jgi:heme exporter protein A